MIFDCWNSWQLDGFMVLSARLVDEVNNYDDLTGREMLVCAFSGKQYGPITDPIKSSATTGETASDWIPCLEDNY